MKFGGCNKKDIVPQRQHRIKYLKLNFIFHCTEDDPYLCRNIFTNK